MSRYLRVHAICMYIPNNINTLTHIHIYIHTLQVSTLVSLALSVCLSVRLTVSLSPCLFVCLSACLPAWACLPVCPPYPGRTLQLFRKCLMVRRPHSRTMPEQQHTTISLWDHGRGLHTLGTWEAVGSLRCAYTCKMLGEHQRASW